VEQELLDIIARYGEHGSQGPDRQYDWAVACCMAEKNPARKMLYAALVTECAVESSTGNPGDRLAELETADEKPHFPVVRLYALCARAVAISYGKGDFRKAMQLVEAAESILAAEPQLHDRFSRKVRTQRAFLHAYMMEFDSAAALFGRLLEESGQGFGAGLARAGLAYVSMLQYSGGTGASNHLRRAWYQFTGARCCMVSAGAQSFVEHIDLYRAICCYKLGGGDLPRAFGLFESLCGPKVVYPSARRFAPLGAWLCLKAGVPGDGRDRMLELFKKEEADWKKAGRPPKFYRMPELFYLYCEYLADEVSGVGFRRGKVMLRHVVEPYKRMLEHIGGVKPDEGYYTSRTHLVNIVSNFYSRLVDMYEKNRSMGEERTYALFALDKARYPYVRCYDGQTKENGVTHLLDKLAARPGTAFAAIKAGPLWKTVTYWVYPGRDGDAGFGVLGDCHGPKDALGRVLDMLHAEPKELFMHVGAGEISVPLHTWACEHFGRLLPVYYTTNFELLCRKMPLQTKPPSAVHLHLPGTYDNRLPVDTKLIETAVMRHAEVIRTEGMLDLKKVWNNKCPMIIVGHGDEKDGVPVIDFGDGNLFTVDDAAWHTLTFEKRGLLFLSCHAGRTHTASRATLNFPVAFLNAGGLFAMAHMQEVDTTSVPAAVDAFFNLLSGRQAAVPPSWRLFV